MLETVSDRKYKSGQGYEMTYTVTANGVHRLRVVVHRGNSPQYTFARVDRWNGEQWHEVVRLIDTDVLISEAPSYVCWDWEEPDPMKKNTRQDCIEWLDRVGDRALTLALEVVL